MHNSTFKISQVTFPSRYLYKTDYTMHLAVYSKMGEGRHLAFCINMLRFVAQTLTLKKGTIICIKYTLKRHKINIYP